MKHEKIANNSGAQLSADSGYQGFRKLYENTVLPKKSTKNHHLRSKAENKTEISQENVSLLTT